MWSSTFEIGAAQLRSVLEITPPQPYLCEPKPYPAIWFAWQLKVVRTWLQAQPQSDNETVEPRYNEHPYDQHPSLRSVSFSPLPLHSSLFALVPIFSTNSRGNASFAGYQHPNISNDWNSPTQQFFHSLGNDSLYSPLYISHNTPCLHPKIFHNLCL